MLGVDITAQTAAAGSVTFHRDVVPILQKNCQNCHRPGQIAPMSLLTYKDARPWARAIKNAVASRTMPPWFADPEYGHFLNERRLAPSDIDTITKWADAGASEGDPKDAPPPCNGRRRLADQARLHRRGANLRSAGKRHRGVDVVRGAWRLHERHVGHVHRSSSEPACRDPSRVSLLRAAHAGYSVQRPDVAAGVIQRDAEGNEIRQARGQGGGPEQAARPRGAARGREAGDGEAPGFPGILGVLFGRSAGTALIEECFEPGRPPADFRPYNAAKLIPAGTDIAVNVHYTPNGTAVTDHVRIGFTLRRNRRSAATSP